EANLWTPKSAHTQTLCVPRGLLLNLHLREAVLLRQVGSLTRLSAYTLAQVGTDHSYRIDCSLHMHTKDCPTHTRATNSRLCVASLDLVWLEALVCSARRR